MDDCQARKSDKLKCLQPIIPIKLILQGVGPKINLSTPDSQKHLGAEILFQLVVFIQECKGLMPDGSGLNISGSHV